MNEYRVDFINFMYEADSFLCNADDPENALRYFFAMMEQSGEDFVEESVTIWKKIGELSSEQDDQIL